jgi:hypothetical protein
MCGIYWHVSRVKFKTLLSEALEDVVTWSTHMLNDMDLK